MIPRSTSNLVMFLVWLGVIILVLLVGLVSIWWSDRQAARHHREQVEKENQPWRSRGGD